MLWHRFKERSVIARAAGERSSFSKLKVNSNGMTFRTAAKEALLLVFIDAIDGMHFTRFAFLTSSFSRH